MRSLGRTVVLWGILILGGWGAYTAYQNGYLQSFFGTGGEGRGGRGQTVAVVVAPVEQREFVDAIEAVGTGRAKESVDLTAKATETIGALNFQDGQKVNQGDVVAELTNREQSADLAAERAALAEATKTYDRIQELSRSGYSTKAQLDAATAARDSAQARVRALESRLTDRMIKAPFSGVLGLRRVSVGSLVRPGDIITTLDDISLIKVDFTIPETFLSVLSVGMKVRAQVAAFPGRTFEGTVAGIDTRVDPITRAVAVRAEVPNPEGLLRPGMLITVALLKNQRMSLAVHEESIVPLMDKQYVFVVGADMKAERREVKAGARQPGYVEVLSGLKQGERVVTEGLLRIRPGAPVEIVASPPAGSDSKAAGGRQESRK